MLNIKSNPLFNRLCELIPANTRPIAVIGVDPGTKHIGIVAVKATNTRVVLHNYTTQIPKGFSSVELSQHLVEFVCDLRQEVYVELPKRFHRLNPERPKFEKVFRAEINRALPLSELIDVRIERIYKTIEEPSWPKTAEDLLYGITPSSFRKSVNEHAISALATLVTGLQLQLPLRT